MWKADGWKDFAVLDASSGEKLERWGEYTLVRPDPQVIWQTPKNDRRWKGADGHYIRSSSGGGRWEGRNLPEQWQIAYELAAGSDDAARLSFRLQPFKFKHTGVFPEQAANWEWSYGLIGSAGRPVKVLNLFAYTGGATLAALAAGASVTHVDASKGMVGWAKENARLSALEDRPVRWLVDDCTKFVEREIRRGNKYDAIIMDPPSYGRGPKGEVWKLEETVYPLLELCAKVLSDDPLFFLFNSYTTGIQSGVLEYMLKVVLEKYSPKVEAGEVGLPVEGKDLVLPCGAAARVTFGKDPKYVLK